MLSEIHVYEGQPARNLFSQSPVAAAKMNGKIADVCTLCRAHGTGKVRRRLFERLALLLQRLELIPHRLRIILPRIGGSRERSGFGVREFAKSFHAGIREAFLLLHRVALRLRFGTISALLLNLFPRAVSFREQLLVARSQLRATLRRESAKALRRR